jgi:cell pole-organizing protein PopZ
MKQNGEPSVEEILASIKQVIARDHRASTACEASRREPAPAAAPAAARAPQPVIEEPEDILDLVETDRVDAAESGNESPLLTEQTRAAMRESLAALAAISGPGAMPQIVRSGETSLEGLVRELLRPALTEWLDRNLPALVERMVAAEIARIVGKKS